MHCRCWCLSKEDLNISISFGTSKANQSHIFQVCSVCLVPRFSAVNRVFVNKRTWVGGTMGYRKRLTSDGLYDIAIPVKSRTLPRRARESKKIGECNSMLTELPQKFRLLPTTQCCSVIG